MGAHLDDLVSPTGEQPVSGGLKVHVQDAMLAVVEGCRGSAAVTQRMTWVTGLTLTLAMAMPQRPPWKPHSTVRPLLKSRLLQVFTVVDMGHWEKEVWAVSPWQGV